jgi:hypothetical protein
MKIGPCGFCMPVSNGYTALRREAVFKKSPTLPAPMRLVRHFAVPWQHSRGAAADRIKTRCENFDRKNPYQVLSEDRKNNRRLDYQYRCLSLG